MARQLIAEATLLSEAEMFAAESPLGGAPAARSGHEARARPSRRAGAAGRTGGHGVSREAFPAGASRICAHARPRSRPGNLADVPPSGGELVRQD
ncbi:hypothetical protein [Streptomyces sp. NPDC048489]|uniref:hypothetical protein n=1 Tax=Streptomyces sp. NPDC048489 TaxID=3154504 RepID=UPI0034354AEC